MKILGTGLSGLVGSRVTELLVKDFEFQNLSLETGVDITDQKTVDGFFNKSDAPWVFHFAAYTDVDGSEADKNKGEESIAWRVNVRSTEYITEACRRTNKRLLYVSTDYVFNGTQNTYDEADIPDPQGWYAKTKYEGEKRVLTLGSHALICRIANPYRANPVPKPDFVHRIMERLSSGEEVFAPSDQLFIPTFIDDIAIAIELLVKKNKNGIFHVVGNQALSPYKAAVMVAQIFGFETELIHQTAFASYFSGRAPRPLHANLKNDKISKFGIRMKAFEEGLKTVILQERSGSNIKL